MESNYLFEKPNQVNLLSKTNLLFYMMASFNGLYLFITHFTCYINNITSFISNAHISFFSPSLLFSCFGNHLMGMLLQLGLFLLHVHSSSRCPLDISNTRNDSKNGIILVFILGMNS